MNMILKSTYITFNYYWIYVYCSFLYAFNTMLLNRQYWTLSTNFTSGDAFDNNHCPDHLAGLEELDPNHCSGLPLVARSLSDSPHYVWLWVVRILGQSIPPTHTINVVHLTCISKYKLPMVWFVTRHEHLPDEEQMRYVLLYFLVKNNCKTT